MSGEVWSTLASASVTLSVAAAVSTPILAEATMASLKARLAVATGAEERRQIAQDAKKSRRNLKALGLVGPSVPVVIFELSMIQLAHATREPSGLAWWVPALACVYVIGLVIASNVLAKDPSLKAMIEEASAGAPASSVPGSPLPGSSPVTSEAHTQGGGVRTSVNADRGSACASASVTVDGVTASAEARVGPEPPAAVDA